MMMLMIIVMIIMMKYVFDSDMEKKLSDLFLICFGFLQYPLNFYHFFLEVLDFCLKIFLFLPENVQIYSFKNRKVTDYLRGSHGVSAQRTMSNRQGLPARIEDSEGPQTSSTL